MFHNKETPMLGTGHDIQEASTHHVVDAIMSSEQKPGKTPRPSIYDYSEYRSFLRDMLDHKKGINPSYSENAFIFAAGFGKNSRGYFGLLMKNKRNLTAKSIMGFSTAMNLCAEEAIYFENMVMFNQAESEKEKVMFFERMKVGARGKKAKLITVLEHQYRFLNEWHLIVLKEVILLADFREDANWIVAKLGNTLTAEKVTEGLNDLMELGLITRDVNGKLVPCEKVVIFNDNSQNFKSSKNLHKQFAQKAAEAMELPYEQRGAQLMTLCVPRARFEELRNEMKNFTKRILEEFPPSETEPNDLVVQLGQQLLKITE